MKKTLNLRKHFASLVMALMLVTICGMTAFAATKFSDSTHTWKAGISGPLWDQHVYSEYLHNTSIHGASTINANGRYTVHYNVPAKSWAIAKDTAYWDRADYAYYHIGARQYFELF